jgi:hypothetical protein
MRRGFVETHLLNVGS